MTYNAANRKHIRNAEKSQIVLSTIAREVICGLMSVSNGRHWVYDRLSAAQVFTDPFSPDPYIHAYNAGRRAEGIALFNDLITYAPESLQLMMQEADERRITDEQRRKPATGPVEPDTSDDTDEFGRLVDTSVPDFFPGTEPQPAEQGRAKAN